MLCFKVGNVYNSFGLPFQIKSLLRSICYINTTYFFKFQYPKIRKLFHFYKRVFIFFHGIFYTEFIPLFFPVPDTIGEHTFTEIPDSISSFHFVYFIYYSGDIGLRTRDSTLQVSCVSQLYHIPILNQYCFLILIIL